MRHPTPILLAILALAACNDANDPSALMPPLFSGALPLRSINGQDIPWESPAQAGFFITAGRVTIINDTLAERSERVEVRQGDSVVSVGDWSLRGRWALTAGRLVINYPGPLPPSSGFGQGGPADTFFVSAGRLVLKEIGGVGLPSDTTVRVYCRTASC